ncbi:hypothetical protein BDR22DRAFT_819789 [Usnea florida]
MANILSLPVVQVAGRDQEPTFVCTKQGMSQQYDIGYDPLDRCAQTGATSFWAKDTVLVFLCPSFAGLKAQPSFTPGGPGDIYCPLVKNNVFVGQSDPLVKYQRYDLVHQMAHLYLRNGGLTSQTTPKEVTDWNSCVGLGWTLSEGCPSVKNPFNLVYFVAFVNQECTEMPDPFEAPFQNDQTGLLSTGNLSQVLSTNLTAQS